MAVPLQKTIAPREICFELEDNSISHCSGVQFFRARNAADPCSLAVRLAEQFELQNRRMLAILDVQAAHVYNGRDVKLRFESKNTVGAIPLFSPTSAAPDYGLIVKPRFPWASIGPMLAQMGWRIAPTPLKLPLLRRSERRVPLWVLSSMILIRLRALLDSLTRRFELVNEIRSSPRGTVNWDKYAGRYISMGQLTMIPCTYPDLRDDRLLKGAIRHSLEIHLRSLQSQRDYGAFVQGLIDQYEQILQRVRDVPRYEPSIRMLANWLRRPLRTEHFAEGIQAIEWTVEERGLAGVSDLAGIPWKMPMEQFFEAWVETVMQVIARNTGAHLKVARRRETIQPLRWDPPFLGSQKSLIPDLWLEWESTTFIVDAKYKRHWEEIQHYSWFESAEELKEQHRRDLLQVLAYSNLARTHQTIACLIYPCSPENWIHLYEKGHLIHQARITVGTRSLRLWLTAIPMGIHVEKIACPITRELRTVLQSL